ncbi:MAG: YbaB/EbfC family nucleoid-associated protein [Veillonella sp.]|nr:YbaB/EbfC family nucleoid-associated protein [Veillonella sp.]
MFGKGMGNMAGMMKKVQKMQADMKKMEMLEDLVMAAVNEASKKVDDLLAQEMGKVTGGLNLPTGLF